MGAVDSVGAADGSGNGGGVWAGVAGGCGAVAADVSPLPPVCYWTSPCPSQVPLLSLQTPL